MTATRPEPILLFGMPRSGTTWIGKIFDSHPATLYRHEPDSVARLTDLPLLMSGPPAPGQATRLRAYLDLARRMTSPKVVGKLPLFKKDYLSAPRFAMYRASAFGSKVAGTLGLRVPVIGAPHGAAGVLVWKSIESLGRLGVLVRALPEARAIHILRHPCGYVASVIRGEHHREHAHDVSQDYGVLGPLLETGFARGHGLTLERLKALTPEERLAWRWLLFNEHAAAETNDDGRCLLIVYDEVCSNPTQKAREMLEFAGLAIHPQTSAFIESSTGRAEDAYYSVYKNPAIAANKWRDELDRAEIDRILAVARQGATGRRVVDPPAGAA